MDYSSYNRVLDHIEGEENEPDWDAIEAALFEREQAAVILTTTCYHCGAEIEPTQDVWALCEECKGLHRCEFCGRVDEPEDCTCRYYI